MNPYAEVDKAIADSATANGSTLLDEWAGKPARFFHLPGLRPFESFQISISPPFGGYVEVWARSIDTDDESQFEQRFDGRTSDIGGMLDAAIEVIDTWKHRPVPLLRKLDQPHSNWGCSIALLIGGPLLLLVAFGAAIGGGGCEGRELPCKSDFTAMWITFAIIIASALGLGWLINRMIWKLRSRRR
jgi:hypothetical protein